MILKDEEWFNEQMKDREATKDEMDELNNQREIIDSMFNLNFDKNSIEKELLKLVRMILVLKEKC